MEEEGSRQGTRIQTEDFSVTCSGPKHLRRWPTTHCKTAPRGEQRKSSPTASCPPRCGLDTKRSAEETSGSPLLGRTPACVLYRKMWRKVLVLPCERSEEDRSPRAGGRCAGLGPGGHAEGAPRAAVLQCCRRDALVQDSKGSSAQRKALSL